MVESLGSLLSEWKIAEFGMIKHQTKYEYLLLVHQLLLDEKPLHLDHLSSFRRHEKQLKRAIKREKKLARVCTSVAKRIAKRYVKAAKSNLKGVVSER